MSKPPNPELIEQIQFIVADIIHKRGVSALSMREIAKLAGISATTIYYYFKDKDDLVEKIKIDAFDKLDVFMAKRIDKNSDYETQLKTLLKAFIEWCMLNPNLAGMLFERLPNQTGLSEDTQKKYMKVFYRALKIMIKGKEAGEFDFTDAQIDVSVGFSIIYGVVNLHLNKRFPEQFWGVPDPIFDRAIEVISTVLTMKSKNKSV